MANGKPWTAAEVEVLKHNLDDKRVAANLGRPEHAVRAKRQRMDAKGYPPAETPSFEQDKANSSDQYWKKQYQALEKKYDKALSESSATEQLIKLAREVAPKSYNPMPAIISKKMGKNTPQSAVLLLSDCHVGQVIPANQTLGFGGYDFPTFLARLKFLEDAVISIQRDHTTAFTEELVVCLGGDLIDGALAHGAEAKQRSTLFTQWFSAGHALAQFLRALTPHFPKIRVYNTVGNHPRWGTQHKMPTHNRYSNLDLFLTAYVESLTRDLKTIDWHFDQQPSALFDVQGFRFQLLHGDTMRGGDKALGVPNHAIGRLISANAQLFEKHGETAPHYVLMGHFHREIVLPTAKGAVLVNGGFPGIDGFGLASNFSAVSPSQIFFYVHPNYGKTAHYGIQLGKAEVGEIAPYEIPSTFSCQ